MTKAKQEGNGFCLIRRGFYGTLPHRRLCPHRLEA